MNKLDIEGKTTDSQIILLEEQFDSAMNRICQIGKVQNYFSKNCNSFNPVSADNIKNKMIFQIKLNFLQQEIPKQTNQFPQKFKKSLTPESVKLKAIKSNKGKI